MSNNIEWFGTGPINDRLNFFFALLDLNGIHIKNENETDNITAVKSLHDLLLRFQQMPTDETQHPKCNVKSRDFRTKGNKLFGNQKLSEALEMYNKAICWAENENGEDLGIGYANRSAVYLKWKLYSISIENIDMALKNRCPQNVLTKLEQRRANCEVQIEKEHAEKASVSTNRCGQRKLVTLHLHGGCMESSERRDFQTKRYAFDVHQHHLEPKLSLEANPKIPFIVNCLEMKSNHKQGRHIITKEDLKPGQIISIEDPYSNSLTKEYRYRKCANCFAENFLSLIPCPSCTCTMFCSEQCLAESEKGFHLFECPIAEYIWTQCEEFALTLRMVVKVFTTFDSIQELVEFREKNKKSNVTAFSFDYNNKLNEKERYSQVDNLLTNEKKRSEGDMFGRCCKVAMLYHQLIEKTKFREMLRTQRDRDTLMSVILQHTQVSSINCFNCHQYDNIDMDDFLEFKPMNVFSRGIYPLSSLFNHSCAPNIATIASGTKLVTYVTRPIKSNTEILGCYKRFSHFDYDKTTRIRELSLIYNFDCNCEACRCDYPMWHETTMPAGNLSREISYLSETYLSDLNMEFNKIDKFSSILKENVDHYPSLPLFKIGLKLHRALTLKFGNLSTELQVTLNENNANIVAAMQALRG